MSNCKRRDKKEKVVPKDESNLKTYIKDFCENTSLHGLKYAGDRNLTLFERIYFGVAFLIAFIIAIQFIFKVYNKWSSTPVIIGFSAIPFYINKIPFPTVTICNMNQAMASRVKNINKTTVEYSILQTLCSREIDLESDAVNSTTDWTVFENFIRANTQPCESMLLKCTFGSRRLECSDIFESVLTDEGLCCTFNSLDEYFLYKGPKNNSSTLTRNGLAVDWSPETGYEENLTGNFIPRTAAGTGSGMGLSVVLNAEVAEYYCSSSNGAGFKVLLHNPAEVPTVGDTGVIIKTGYESRIIITPIKLDSSVALRSMKKESRQCVFENEGNLSYFDTYSRRNCEMECEAEVLAAECSCISYYMPRIVPNISICGLKDLICRENINKKIVENVNNLTDCSEQCLSSCFELSYISEVFTSPIAHNGFKIKDKFLQNISSEYTTENIASAHFYYMEKAFRSSTKEQFIGFTEFLSNTGGLMGLFVGFSFISLIEIIYYATFRPYWIKKRNKLEPTENQIRKPGRKLQAWKSKEIYKGHYNISRLRY